MDHPKLKQILENFKNDQNTRNMNIKGNQKVIEKNGTLSPISRSNIDSKELKHRA